LKEHAISIVIAVVTCSPAILVALTYCNVNASELCPSSVPLFFYYAVIWNTKYMTKKKVQFWESWRRLGWQARMAVCLLQDSISVTVLRRKQSTFELTGH